MSASWLERPASWSPAWVALSPGSTATRAGSCLATAAKDTSRNDWATVAPGAFLRDRRGLVGSGLRRHLLRYAASPAISAEASADVRRGASGGFHPRNRPARFHRRLRYAERAAAGHGRPHAEADQNSRPEDRGSTYGLAAAPRGRNRDSRHYPALHPGARGGTGRP